MKKLFIITIIILLPILLFAGNRIPIPNKQISYVEADIITNPVNGEKFVYNQLLVVFSPTVTRHRQEEILKSIDGRVVGGLPAFDIYQITFENSEKSFSKLARVQFQLEKNEHILFAMPQNVEKRNLSKTKNLVASASSERTGELNSANIRRKSTSRSSNGIQNTINGHWSGLNACIEKQNRIVNAFHGKISFVLTVTPKGQVEYTRVSRSNIRDKRVTACLLKKIRKWRDFPRSKGKENRQIEFEFAF